MDCRICILFYSYFISILSNGIIFYCYLFYAQIVLYLVFWACPHDFLRLPYVLSKQEVETLSSTFSILALESTISPRNSDSF